MQNKEILNILFVTWDGPQTSYLESLFLPIFERLLEYGFSFHVLQFTWGSPKIVERVRRACEGSGIAYDVVRVRRRPVTLGSLFAVIEGAMCLRSAIRKHNIDAVMPRSTLPALATLFALRGASLPIIFDADGLPLDERVDFSGQSSTGLVYRLLRDIEAQTVRRAELVITRTAAAANILHARAGAGATQKKFHIVSNGRNVNRFNSADAESRKRVRQSLQLAEHAPLIIYAGSIGPQYCLDEMLQVFSAVRTRKADAHFLILTGAPELVANNLTERFELVGAVTTMSVSALEVPEYLACADLGLALRRPSFSMQGVAPIKLGEYLLCGLPVVATSEIGDTASITTNTGFLVRSLSKNELLDAANWFVDRVLEQRDNYRKQCREAGLQNFSLEASTQSYANALSTLHRVAHQKRQT